MIPERVREDFPILHTTMHGKPLIYLDSAGSSQKPRAVLDALRQVYEESYANVHRGIYALAETATQRFEAARVRVARFINAPRAEEIIFTRGTTESINLVAYAWGRANVRAGDEILLTEMEHHSNIVPWQLLAAEKGARLRYLSFDGQGRLAVEELDSLLTERTKLVAVTHQSNVLGTINPVAAIARKAHAAGALVLVDGAQSVPHMPVDVQALGCDFLAFSAHKMCGPSGVGALWARYDLLDAMPPFHGGGEMIMLVGLDSSTYKDPPHKFEAGTPNIADAIVWGTAIDYLDELGMGAVREHERQLVRYALGQLREIRGLRVHGPNDLEQRGGAIAFEVEGAHPHDVAQILDQEGVAVRAGHHCAQPLHRRLGLAASTRASLYLYNTPEDIDALTRGLEVVQRYFAPRPTVAGDR